MRGGEARCGGLGKEKSTWWYFPVIVSRFWRSKA